MSRAIHRSFWLQHEPLQQRFDKLSANHQTEILVIGAGITGLTIATELAGRGHRVTVCESETIGAGTTAGSSGHLDAHPEMGPANLVKQMGEQAAGDYVRIRQQAIETIRTWAGEHCDFTPVAAYMYSENADDHDSLRKDCDAGKRIGLEAAWTHQIPVPKAKCGYRINGLARIDCGKYLRRLTEIAVDRGVQIFEHTLVSGPVEKEPHRLEAGDHEIQFDHVVCAVHCNFTDSMRLYAATPPYQSYVLVARLKDEFPDALFWDNSDPYFYLRRATSDQPNLLLAGGRDHRTGLGKPAESLLQLEAWVRDRFDVQEIVSSWSAELFEPSDGLPMIGKVADKKNVWVATGLSGVGLTLGTASGQLIADMIEDKQVRLADEFSPARLGVSKPLDWVSEQAQTAANYAERVLPASTVDPAKLQPGQGAVGTIDGTHVAVCRDHSGCEHRHSPICSHMGGVVHWNEVEQTWDCPVHGGRFTADGTRLYGPPESKLEAAKGAKAKSS